MPAVNGYKLSVIYYFKAFHPINSTKIIQSKLNHVLYFTNFNMEEIRESVSLRSYIAYVVIYSVIYYTKLFFSNKNAEFEPTQLNRLRYGKQCYKIRHVFLAYENTISAF